jgi:hypothetical protein
VLRHRTFGGLWLLNCLFVAAGYSLITRFPQFARDHGGVSEREIGVVFAVNTAVIVVVQLPLARWIEGRRRMRRCDHAGALAIAWLIVDGAGAWLRPRTFLAFALAAGHSGSASAFTDPVKRSSPIAHPPLRSTPVLGPRRHNRAGVSATSSRTASVPPVAAACASSPGRRAPLERFIPPLLRIPPRRSFPALAEPVAAA